ncbi:MAG: type IV secretory system conjugative DNA transfer family protein, partial [Blastocatellia bacterium]
TLPAVADLLLKGWRATQAAISAVRPDLNANLVDIWEIQSGKLAELFTGLAVRLELFRQPGPRAAFSRRDFSLADVVPPLAAGNSIQRTILIVGAPQSRQSHSGLLASLMTQFLAQSVYFRRDEMAAEGCRWTDVVPVAVYLDEFGTYNIPGIDTFVATARSGAAGVVAALQNENQLTQFYGGYGRDAVTAMLTNFRTKIYLKGCHSRVAAELSEQTGTKLVSDHIANSSRSAEPVSLLPRSFSRGEQTRPVEVPVLTPDDIEFMPDNEAIVVGWTKPAKVELVRYYEDPRIEPWVVQSQEEVGLRSRQNAECDKQGVARPRCEPMRLPQYEFDWSLIPGVTNAIARQEGADLPMATEQKGKILAKLRDLGIAEVEGI